LEGDGVSEAIELRDEDNYALTALSSSGNSFTISKASGVTSRTCSAAGVSTGGLQRHQLVSRLAYPSIPTYGGVRKGSVSTDEQLVQ